MEHRLPILNQVDSRNKAGSIAEKQARKSLHGWKGFSPLVSVVSLLHQHAPETWCTRRRVRPSAFATNPCRSGRQFAFSAQDAFCLPLTALVSIKLRADRFIPIGDTCRNAQYPDRVLLLTTRFRLKS